jgi:hypothetical protein
MRVYCLSFLMFCMTVMASAEDAPRDKPKSSLSILLAGNVPRQRVAIKGYFDGTVDPKSISGERTLLVSDHDIVSYDRKTHVFRVKAEAAKRIVTSLGWRSGISGPDGKASYGNTGPDQVLIVAVRDEPVYVAVSTSSFSSSAYNLPELCLVKDEFSTATRSVKDEFLAEERVGDVGFYVALPKFAGVDYKDPRSDKRIFEALDKLGL